MYILSVTDFYWSIDMFIQLEYDKATGQITDPNTNCTISTWMGLEGSEVKEQKTSDVSELVKLKDAGFTADEIMQMKREELV